MIKSFRDKRLRLLWETGKNSKLPADQLIRKIHPLKGNLKGNRSLTVKENWRIIFRFDGNNTFDIDYLDYH